MKIETRKCKYCCGLGEYNLATENGWVYEYCPECQGRGVHEVIVLDEREVCICPECEGKGWVGDDTGMSIGLAFSKFCKSCNGTGTILQ